MSEREVVCRDLVEKVTDYLDGALEPALATRVEEHLVVCQSCATHVDHLRLTAAALARLRHDEPAPPELTQAFREWSRR